MKYIKQILAVTLCLLLVLSLVACASTTPTTTAPDVADVPVSNDEPVNEPTTDEPVEEPADEPTEAPAETPEEPVEVETPVEPVVNNVTMTVYGNSFDVPQAAIDGVALPLVDEPAELSMFWQWSNNYVGNPMEMYIYQEREARTGVTVDYVCVSAAEQFQIMYASQDYEDIIKTGATSYVGGVDKAIEDEIYVDAADYLHLMPVFSGWMTTSEEYAKDCKTDSGAYYFNSVQLGREPAWCGGVMRADWLEECGLDTPVTFDDWHEALTAFKEQKGAESPLSLSSVGYDNMGYTLHAGYDAAPGWYQIDGEIKYGFVEEGMKEYLTMMNQWYSEGLVNRDFPGYISCFVEGATQFTQGTTGAWDWASQSHLDQWVMMNGGEGKLTAVASPVKNEGDEYHFRRHNGISGGNCTFITTAAVERGVDELCARWIDYLYTLDCAYLTSFGQEGLDWEWGEDGIPHFTDHYRNHPDGKSVYNDSHMDQLTSCAYIWWREFDTKSENALNAYRIWQDSTDAAYMLPQFGASLTAEESEIYSTPFNDISTYVDENIPLFIRGDRSLDEWDDFVATLYQFGLQDCIDIYQAAFDRYNTR